MPHTLYLLCHVTNSVIKPEIIYNWWHENYSKMNETYSNQKKKEKYQNV